MFRWLASVLYGAGVRIRHKGYDWGLIASREFDVPVVCVGNLTVGGTGKTPMTELLVDRLSRHFRVAVLSRGYKRRTKGFLEVGMETPFLDVGDEPKQIKLKFPDVVVAVCKEREAGIERIRELHPEVNLVLLDDGFQYRKVEAWANIILMDYGRPIYKDRLLPRGRLRDTRGQLYRANFVVVTKCPPEMSPLDMRIVRKSLELLPYQGLFFSNMCNGMPTALFPDVAERRVAVGDPVVVMAGIGAPEPFVRAMREKFHVVDTLIFPDHHPYRMRDLKRMQQALDDAPEGAILVTTEKDAVKLTNRRKIPADIQRRLYFVPVHLEFIDDSEGDFLRKLYHYVRSNQKYSLLHS